MVSTNLGDRYNFSSDRLKIFAIFQTIVKNTYKIKIPLNFIVGFFSSWRR
ncbi:hypothetical protein [Okeania sp. SIO3B5]|nr:hypothetical protein [Okeania sp. SIO3B5]NEO57167.1 hypothetical protein [Okeania sp. SIO3B5]